MCTAIGSPVKNGSLSKSDHLYRSTIDRPPFWPRKFCRRTLVRLFYSGVIIFMVGNRPLFKLNMSQHRWVSIKTLKLPPLTLFKIGREKLHPLKNKKYYSRFGGRCNIDLIMHHKYKGLSRCSSIRRTPCIIMLKLYGVIQAISLNLIYWGRKRSKRKFKYPQVLYFILNSLVSVRKVRYYYGYISFAKRSAQDSL